MKIDIILTVIHHATYCYGVLPPLWDYSATLLHITTYHYSCEGQCYMLLPPLWDYSMGRDDPVASLPVLCHQERNRWFNPLPCHFLDTCCHQELLSLGMEKVPC